MNIYEKINKIMADTPYIFKDGKIEFKNTKYRAVTEENVLNMLRPKMIEQGLVMFPVSLDFSKDEIITTANMVFKVVNAENPEEYILVASGGQGADSQDKGIGKAITYANKYALLKMFLVPTGDDPDKVSSEEITAKLNEAYAKKEQEKGEDDLLRKQIYELGKGDLTRINEYVGKIFGGKILGELTTEELRKTKVAIAKAVSK